MKNSFFYLIGFIILFVSVLVSNPPTIKAAQCLGTEGNFCAPGNRAMYCYPGSNEDWELIEDCNPSKTCLNGACIPF